jgi:hypothetical protein
MQEMGEAMIQLKSYAHTQDDHDHTGEAWHLNWHGCEITVTSRLRHSDNMRVITTIGGIGSPCAMLDDMWSEITPELLETLFMQSHTETWDDIHECTIAPASGSVIQERTAAVRELCPECNGTGTYVGFNKTESCSMCGGK